MNSSQGAAVTTASGVFFPHFGAPILNCTIPCFAFQFRKTCLSKSMRPYKHIVNTSIDYNHGLVLWWSSLNLSQWCHLISVYPNDDKMNKIQPIKLMRRWKMSCLHWARLLLLKISTSSHVSDMICCHRLAPPAWLSMKTMEFTSTGEWGIFLPGHHQLLLIHMSTWRPNSAS